VFYVPPVGSEFNIAASVWHSFLAERNKSALMLHKLRLQALDPTARANALRQAYEAETDRIKALNARLAEAEKTKRTLAPEAMRAVVQFARMSTDASIANMEAKSKEGIAGLIPPQTASAQKHIQKVTGLLDQIEANRGNPQEQARLWGEVRAADKARVAAGISIEGGEARAYNRIINDRITRMQGFSEDALVKLQKAAGTYGDAPDEPITRAGAPDITEAMSTFGSILEGHGIPAASLFGAGSETGSSRSRAGTAPTTLSPSPGAGAGGTPTTGAAAEAGEDLTGFVRPAAPAAPPGMGFDLVGATQAMQNKWPYGRFHEPLPEHELGMKHPRIRRKVARMTPEQKVDLAIGAEDGPEAIQTVRSQRMVSEVPPPIIETKERKTPKAYTKPEEMEVEGGEEDALGQELHDIGKAEGAASVRQPTRRQHLKQKRSAAVLSPREEDELAEHGPGGLGQFVPKLSKALLQPGVKKANEAWLQYSGDDPDEEFGLEQAWDEKADKVDALDDYIAKRKDKRKKKSQAADTDG
jgi:hypothetical protein